MTHVRRGVLWGLWILLSAAPAHGQQAGSSDRNAGVEQFLDRESGLSLSDAIKSALEREPAIRAARTEVDAARGMRVQAGLRPNPMFAFEQREQPDGEDNQTMLGVEWALDLFRRAPRVAVADREVEAVEHSVADRERILVAAIRLKYGEAATAIRALAIANELAISAERDFTLRRARVDEGASPPLERDLLDVEFRRRDSERLVAEGMAQAAMIELRRVIGLRPESTLRLRDTIDTLVPQLNVNASPPSLAPRPDVREAEVRVQLADARIDRARAEGRFDVSLFGSYMRMASSFPQQGFNANGTLEPVQGVFRYLIGGTTITLPLRNRKQGEVAAARAERAGAEARLEAARLAADADAASTLAQDERARQALQVIESAVGLSRRNVDVLRQTYELGRATISEVLAEQRRHLELENAYTELLKRTYEARVLLLRARGELP
jgi:outer membrane protein, heavy metal efflux system